MADNQRLLFSSYVFRMFALFRSVDHAQYKSRASSDGKTKRAAIPRAAYRCATKGNERENSRAKKTWRVSCAVILAEFLHTNHKNNVSTYNLYGQMFNGREKKIFFSSHFLFQYIRKRNEYFWYKDQNVPKVEFLDSGNGRTLYEHFVWLF